MAFNIYVMNVSQITKTHYRIVMQDKIFKVLILEVTHKSVTIFLPQNIQAIRQLHGYIASELQKIPYMWYVWQTLSLAKQNVNANWQIFSLANRMSPSNIPCIQYTAIQLLQLNCQQLDDGQKKTISSACKQTSAGSNYLSEYNDICKLHILLSECMPPDDSI